MRSGSVSRVLCFLIRKWWSFIWACHCWQARAAYPEACAGHAWRFPMRPCCKWGLPCPRPLPCGAVRSYRTVSPLPGMPGGLFSVALSRGHPRRTLSGILPCAARTFLDSAVKYNPAATTRTAPPYNITGFGMALQLFLAW